MFFVVVYLFVCLFVSLLSSFNNINVFLSFISGKKKRY